MKFTCLSYPGENGSHAVLLTPQSEAWPAVRALLDKSAQKHSGFITWDMSLPYRPLTRGPKKQNKDDPGYQMNHAWGHATQIAGEIGEDARDVLYEACIASAPRYPTRMDAFGKIKAKRWSLASVEEAAIVIEKLHQIAAQWTPPIVLREK